MKMNKELFDQARQAKSTEELIALAKENDVELSDEQANAYFAKLNSENGELGDDELDNVAGGGCGESDYDNFYNYKPLSLDSEPCEHWFCCRCNSMKGWCKCGPWGVAAGCPGCRFYIENGTRGYCTYEFQQSQK